MDLGDFESNTAYAQYSTFSIGDDITEYTLNVGGYSGTAGDAFIGGGGKYLNGMKFSTKDNDNDNDENNGNCAIHYKGA